MRRHPRPGEGEGVQQGREQRWVLPRGGTHELKGGHTTRGGRPSAARRHTGGPGVGWGRPQAGSNPLTPNPPIARAARTLKAFNPR